MKVNDKLFFMSRPKKRIISCLCDAVFISVAYFFAFFVRLDHLNVIYSVELWKALVPLILLTIFIFSQLGLYRAILRYLTFQALFVVSIGTLFSMFAFYGLRFYIDELVPRTVPIIYALFLVLFAGGSRMIMRNYISNRNVFKSYRKNVIIYGAGSTGRQLCFTLRSNQEYKVVAFVDKDPTLFNTNIMGVRVYNSDDITKVIDKKMSLKYY